MNGKPKQKPRKRLAQRTLPAKLVAEQPKCNYKEPEPLSIAVREHGKKTCYIYIQSKSQPRVGETLMIARYKSCKVKKIVHLCGNEMPEDENVDMIVVTNKIICE